MKICLIGSSLSLGGAERVLCTMANYWAAKGREVSLITLGSQSDFYRLDSRVRFVPLRLYAVPLSAAPASLARPTGADPRILKVLLVRTSDPVFHFLKAMRLRRAIKTCAPSAIVSFVDRINVLTLIATRGLKIPVIVSERTDLSCYKIGAGWDLLRQTLYPWASKVVIQCESIRSALPVQSRATAEVIPNPIAPEFVALSKTNRTSPGRTVIAMGRLSAEKGFDLLLEAFARVATQFSDWDLEIWGEGPMRAELEGKALALGIGRRVRLPGVTSRPAEVLKSADLFVLSSRFEGFPNVLLEAMSVGVPAISFDCPSGPSAIIRDGVDGLLVRAGELEGLARAIKRLIDNPEERARLGARATEVNERFALERVMGEWEKLLLTTLLDVRPTIKH